MQNIRMKILGAALGVVMVLDVPVLMQNIQVNVGGESGKNPCESVTPASIDGEVDIPALIKETICKGSGNMLLNYTYSMEWSQREKKKDGKIKLENRVFEVYLPEMKTLSKRHGILLLTHRNGIPVPPAEMEEARMDAGEKLMKEQEKAAQADKANPSIKTTPVTGMKPLGQYFQMKARMSIFVITKNLMTLDVSAFLQLCDLTFLKREIINQRDTLIFKFNPRADARFADEFKYITRLGGIISIDAQDRILTRLSGWPSEKMKDIPGPQENEPVVYAEMYRTSEGDWVPAVFRINGADYPGFFKKFPADQKFTFSDYKRFKTSVENVTVESPEVE